MLIFEEHIKHLEPDLIEGVRSFCLNVLLLHAPSSNPSCVRPPDQPLGWFLVSKWVRRGLAVWVTGMLVSIVTVLSRLPSLAATTEAKFSAPAESKAMVKKQNPPLFLFCLKLFFGLFLIPFFFIPDFIFSQWWCHMTHPFCQSHPHCQSSNRRCSLRWVKDLKIVKMFGKTSDFLDYLNGFSSWWWLDYNITDVMCDRVGLI